MTAQTTLLIQKAIPLLEAFKERNFNNLISAWQIIYTPHIFQEVLDASPEETLCYQQLFEITDDILEQWWLSENEPQEIWRTLMLPKEHLFSCAIIIINAFWLRLSQSTRMNQSPALLNVEEFTSLAYPQMAKKLARFCLHCDATTPIEYQKIAQCLPKSLLPFWTYWFLRVYLMSPLSSLDNRVHLHREQAIQDFIEFHQDKIVTIPLDFALGTSGYRMAYHAFNIRNFLECFTNQILLPSFIAATGIQEKNHHTIPINSPPRIAIVLNQWTLNHVIYRCMEPLLSELCQSGCYGLLIGNEAVANKINLPTNWRQSPIEIMEWNIPLTAENLAHIAKDISALNLDFLFYPEVGLNISSRWLSLLQLARIQATGYGHPVTTGSKAIQYFVGGEQLESDPEQYTEKLVLLPGLGVSSHPPPLAVMARQRPLDDKNLFLFNLSSYDKYNPALLQAWATILKTAPDNLLHLFPAISEGYLQRELPNIASFFSNLEVVAHPSMPRQEVINTLVEADLYLDSYPFGGFNTLVEVLASGCPVVTLEGNSARNRFGAVMLRLLKLPEFLIAQSVEEYVQSAIQLMTNHAIRLEIRAKLTREYVLKTLCDATLPNHFKATILHLLETPLILRTS